MDLLKPCVKCEKVDRYKNGVCKPCHKARSRAAYNADKEAAKVYQRKYNQENHEKVAAAASKRSKKSYLKNKAKILDSTHLRYRKNKVVILARAKEYRQENKKEIAAYNKQYREEHANEIKARSAVAIAKQSGKLKKASEFKCKDCDKQAMDYHHWSYLPEHWLDVIALCRGCHRLRETKGLENQPPK